MKFQLTNIMNKKFIIFFNCNINDSYSELIIVKNLNNLINTILNKNSTSIQKNFSIYVINVSKKTNNINNFDNDKSIMTTDSFVNSKKINLEITLK